MPNFSLLKVADCKITKDNRHIGGFMADGFNEVAAMKASNAGISVDTAVNIARESADVILLEKPDGFGKRQHLPRKSLLLPRGIFKKPLEAITAVKDGKRRRRKKRKEPALLHSCKA
ncbi:MAG: hypothetical protein EGQ81_03095 [Akkermansia sp.]|nr:hypothetical protein [Akkermansia sp.]